MPIHRGKGAPYNRALFTLPNQPRGDGANVVWMQPQDDQIFAAFRDDVSASSALFTATAGQQAVQAYHQAAPTGRPGKFGVITSAPASISARTANQYICVN